MTAIHPARYRNTMIGLAAGDAWGYQVEFTKYSKMTKPVAMPHGDWIISDDTQMTLALEAAVDTFTESTTIDEAATAIMDEFVTWSHSPLNTRAPGSTCMGAVENYDKGEHWAASGIESNGCGSVMRLLPTIALDEPLWRGATALQALVTHSHPAAVASSLALGELARSIANTDDYSRMPYLVTHMAKIAVEPMFNQSYELDDCLLDVLDYVWYEPHTVLETGADSLYRDNISKGEMRFFTNSHKMHSTDICKGVGQGWDASSAIVLGAMAADAAIHRRLDVDEAMHWAVASDGDSDSIAAIAGMLIGLSSEEEDFWLRNGIDPRFEDEYDTLITRKR